MALGTFVRQRNRLLTSSNLSDFGPRASTRLPVDGFREIWYWGLLLKYWGLLLKYVLKYQNLLKLNRRTWHFA